MAPRVTLFSGEARNNVDRIAGELVTGLRIDGGLPAHVFHVLQQ